MSLTRTTPRFKTYTRTCLFLKVPIHFQLTTMDSSIFAWAGTQGGNMAELAVAMPPAGQGSLLPATTILGRNVADASQNIGKRLALRYKYQFFVSLNFPVVADETMVRFAEKKLGEFVKEILANDGIEGTE